MKALIGSLLVILGLAGCASDYTKYGDMQIAVQTAKYQADAAKYNAISAIAQSGDTTAKVAAMFSLQNVSNQSNSTNQLAAPKSVADNIREWVALIIPTLVQGYGIHANQQIAVTQSNNSRDVAVSTNQAFVGIASQIQAPAANMSVSGNGVIGSGSYAAPAQSYNPISGSYNPAPIDNSNQGNLACTTGPC